MNLRSATATAVLGSLGLLAMVALAWTFLLGPALEDVATTEDSVVAAEDRNALLRSQLAGLERQAADLERTRAAAAEVGRLFPPTADQPGFFQMVNAAAARAGVGADDVVTLSPSAPLLVSVGPDGVTFGDADAQGASDPGNDAADSGSDEADEAGDGSAAVTQYGLQTVTLSVEGTYTQAAALLAELERLPRSVLVQSVVLTELEQSGVTLTVTGSTFVAPPVPEPDVPTPDPASTPG